MRAARKKISWSTSSCVALFLAFLNFAALPADASTNDPASGKLVILRNQARSYEHGEGVPRDPVRAASLYCDGARNGDTEAQFNIGWMYANGRGIRRNDEVAAYFFKLAAEKGHEQAQKMLRFVGEKVAPVPACMRNSSANWDHEDVLKGTNSSQQAVLVLVHKLAPEYGVSPRLVMAVIRNESNFETGAVSPKNAQGLMQLIPETSARFNVKKPFDPEQNIRGGLSYLRWLLAYFEGNVELVAAAYNAGEGAVDRYKGVPPYPETRGYVKRIMSIVQRDEHPFDPGVTTPSPQLPRIRLAKGL